MGYLTEDDKRNLKDCQTVGDMLHYLTAVYDLNIIPGIITKTAIVSGLDGAMNLIKPIRRQRIRRVQSNETTSL